MNEATLTIVCIAGVVVAAIIIVVIANFIGRKSIERRSKRMMKDIENGTLDKNKKYFGEQGGWETDAYTDITNHPPQ